MAEVGIKPEILERRIRQWCGLFVFIHQTAQEFLIHVEINGAAKASPWHFKSQDAEGEMSHICVRYLLLDDLECNPADAKFNVQSFLAYSAEHWADHVRSIPPSSEPELENLLYQLYDTDSPRFGL